MWFACEQLINVCDCSSGVTLSLNETSLTVREADSSVEVCVRLEGELETSVSAMVFPVPGDASGESAYCNTSSTQSFCLVTLKMSSLVGASTSSLSV